jgi:DNA uptake protein ComE-like DNA-binding protein
MASNEPMNLHKGTENDLKSLDGIGNAKAKQMLDARKAKENLIVNDVAEANCTLKVEGMG